MTKPIPQAIKNHRYSHIWVEAWKKPNIQNKMFSAVFVAAPGSGKSWSAISLADLMEEGNFDINRVAFSASQFAKLVSEQHPAGTVIVLDDCGLMMFSRDAMSKISKNLAKTLQSVRYKNLILLLTLPDLTMLDSAIRRLIDSIIDIRGIDSSKQEAFGKFHWLQTNTTSGKIYRHSPEKVVYSTNMVGMRIRRVLKIPMIRFDRPRQELINLYEQKKKIYLDARNLEAYKELKELEAPKQKRLKFNDLLILAKERRSQYVKKGFIQDELIMADLDCGVKMAAKIRRSLKVLPII